MYFPTQNILDLFLTNDSDWAGQCKVLHPIPGYSHSTVIVDYVSQSFSDDNHSQELVTDDRL